MSHDNMLLDMQSIDFSHSSHGLPLIKDKPKRLQPVDCILFSITRKYTANHYLQETDNENDVIAFQNDAEEYALDYISFERGTTPGRDVRVIIRNTGQYAFFGRFNYREIRDKYIESHKDDDEAHDKAFWYALEHFGFDYY